MHLILLIVHKIADKRIKYKCIQRSRYTQQKYPRPTASECMPQKGSKINEKLINNYIESDLKIFFHITIIDMASTWGPFHKDL